jgi:hypothetical protein
MPPLSELDRQAFYNELSGPSENIKDLLYKTSGGLPPMFAHCCNSYLEQSPTCSQEKINRKEFLEQVFDFEAEQLLEAIWSDLNVESKDFLIALMSSGKSGISYEKSNCKKSDLRDLEDLGFIKKENTCYHISSFILEGFLTDKSETSGYLARIFATKSDCDNNIKEVLERNFSFVAEGLPPDLRRAIDYVISDIPNDPTRCLKGDMREVEDQVVALIIREEFPDKALPIELPYDTRQKYNNKVPGSRGKLVDLIEILVGLRPDLVNVAKVISKNTSILFTAIHNYGRIGNHHEGETILLPTAIAAAHTCVSLAESLAEDLRKKQNT